jgi:hypothetical protein
MFADETNLDSELFWGTYSQITSIPPSPVCVDKIKHMSLSNFTECPRVTTAERLAFIALAKQRWILPRELAIYLDIESLEAAYPSLEDNLKRDLLRVALNQWSFCLEDPTLSDEWDATFRALFAAGARFEVLCSERLIEILDEATSEKPEAQVLIEVIRHFVRPYAWRATDWYGGLVKARDTLRGLRHLISRTEEAGIKLETIQSCKRLEICFDEEFMRSSGDMIVGYPCIHPHTLSLHYDDGSSTWVMWNSTYEEYCGEFWDLLEHPARMFPGTWVD